MIFQCEASELEKAISKIKQWKAQLDTVPKNLKRINAFVFEITPVEVHLSLTREQDAITLSVIYGGKDDLLIIIKGVVLDNCFSSSQMNLDQFYYLCEAHRAKLTGKIQIHTTPYRIDLYQVEE